ncbi:MAG: Cna B-type domain-containing protein [Clostridia bacterium]|nr:Cna B-type domain-containing protein [Clostridia bacterium]
MKKRIGIFALCFAVVFLFCSLSSLGANPVDVQAESSLTVQYRAGEKTFSDLTVKTYRVAEIFADGTYELTGDFADYPVNIYGITSKTEWDSAVAALVGYVEADKLAPTAEGVTDAEGKIVFDKLKTGMYLTLGVRHEDPVEITVFDAFLTSVPTPMENAEHLYHVAVFPKSTSFAPTPEEREYKVVKIWKDEGFESRRPQTLTVEILKDGVLQSTQTLSADNNWSYLWTAPVDGSVWTVVERNVPKGYAVAVQVQERSFLLTNTYDEKLGGPKPPHTGDTPVSWPYFLACCGAGFLMITVAVLQKRKAQ